MSDNFKYFSRKAKGKSFKEKLILWDKIIEAPYQDFYDTLVWDKKSSNRWKARKPLLLKPSFDLFETRPAEVIGLFAKFDKVIQTQINRFKTDFPDANFNLPIYISLSPTFNGKVSEIDGKKVLAFGLDKILLLGDDPDTLFSHELFHVYHIKFLALNKDTSKEKFSLPLWMEGLASYISFKYNSKSQMKNIFMSKDLAAIDNDNLKEVAGMFLKEVNLTEKDLRSDNVYRSWFTGNKTLNKTYPARMGYWLGFHLSKKLNNTHALSTMIKWNSGQAHDHIVEALKEISEKSPDY